MSSHDDKKTLDELLDEDIKELAALLDCANDQNGPKILFRPDPPQDFATDWPSATFNHHSRRLWAADRAGRLEFFHQEVEPTHFLTIHYNEPVEDETTFSKYHTKRRCAVDHFNRSKDEYIGGIWVLEIQHNNVCHEHLLVRTSLDDPSTFFSTNATKVNKKLDTKISVDFCNRLETVEDVARATKYIFKLVNDPEKKPVLFKSGLRLRIVGKFGNYYGDKKQKDLKRSVAKQLNIHDLEKRVTEIVKPPERSEGGSSS